MSNQPSTTSDRPAATTAFHWTSAIVGFIFVCGLYLDGWAHNHNRVDNTFFTPWHAVFYSGFALAAIVLLAALVHHHRTGYPWRQAVPRGYRWSLVGIGIFFLSGVGDLIWHTIFGIEANVAALLSPTHLGLATGMLLITAGPFRAAVKDPQPAAGARFAALISLLCVLSILTFLTQYASALFEYGVAPGPPRRYFEIIESRGVIAQMLETAVMMGVVLLMLRTWGGRTPRGAVTMLLVPNALLMATQSDEYRFVWGVLIAALIGDALIAAWRPSIERVWALRAFAFALPFVYWLGHYATYSAKHERLYYSVPVWTGCIVISGFVGLLMSFVAATQGATRASA